VLQLDDSPFGDTLSCHSIATVSVLVLTIATQLRVSTDSAFAVALAGGDRD
jgi:hypothetical protein